MYEFVKRGCDILLSSLGLLVLSPLLVLVAVILKLTGEHYIFYAQQRIGRGGRPFQFLKFATMLKDSPKMGAGDITLRNDPRILPFGHFLRKTKINELPQLINVLKGDMSLIGPRPLTPRNFGYFSDEVKAAIGRIRPGLSGIGSLVFRNEEDMIANSGLRPEEFYEHHIAPYKGELEASYAQHRSVLLDLLVILLTVWIVLFPKSRLHMKLLADLPSPGSAVLARCLTVPLAAEMEEPVLDEGPTIELDVNDFPAEIRLPFTRTRSDSSLLTEQEHLVGGIRPLNRRSIQETTPAEQATSIIGSGPNPT